MQTLTGMFDLAEIILTFEVLCTNNYHGPNCDVLCTTGDCTCDPGFTGPFCASSIDDCVDVDCGVNQRCEDGHFNYTCVCEPGFTGPDCFTNINNCESVNCNSGTCEDGINSFVCICDLGSTGQFCATSINECAGVDCGENQRCVDGHLNYTCVCEPGFTGPDCQTDIDDCVGRTTCANSGTCVDGIDTFTCLCPLGFTGELCETNADLFQLQVTIHSFNNPAGKCADNKCLQNTETCCNGRTCPNECDYYFSLCLRPADSLVSGIQNDGEGNCDVFNTGSMKIANGTAFGSFVFGTPNPITLYGTDLVSTVIVECVMCVQIYTYVCM